MYAAFCTFDAFQANETRTNHTYAARVQCIIVMFVCIVFIHCSQSHEIEIKIGVRVIDHGILIWSLLSWWCCCIRKQFGKFLSFHFMWWLIFFIESQTWNGKKLQPNGNNINSNTSNLSIDISPKAHKNRIWLNVGGLVWTGLLFCFPLLLPPSPSLVSVRAPLKRSMANA